MLIGIPSPITLGVLLGISCAIMGGGFGIWGMTTESTRRPDGIGGLGMRWMNTESTRCPDGIGVLGIRVCIDRGVGMGVVAG